MTWRGTAGGLWPEDAAFQEKLNSVKAEAASAEAALRQQVAQMQKAWDAVGPPRCCSPQRVMGCRVTSGHQCSKCVGFG